jgi:hypothetical protein
MKVITPLLFILITGSALLARGPESIEYATMISYNKYLTQSLDDDNLGIRTSAAQLIGQKGVWEAESALILMLKKDEFYQARIIAGLALMRIGGGEARQAIAQQARKDGNLTVRHVLNGIVQEWNRRELTLR